MSKFNLSEIRETFDKVEDIIKEVYEEKVQREQERFFEQMFSKRKSQLIQANLGTYTEDDPVIVCSYMSKKVIESFFDNIPHNITFVAMNNLEDGAYLLVTDEKLKQDILKGLEVGRKR